MDGPDQVKVKCTSCKVSREPDAFVGKTGGIVKTCIKCRDKDARTKQRPEARAKHAELLRIKRYDLVHRAKKLLSPHFQSTAESYENGT
jgi:hypothetical protein